MKLDDFINKYGNVSVDENELKDLLGIKDEKYFYPKAGEAYYSVDIWGKSQKHFNADNKITARHFENNKITARHFENNEIFATRDEAKEYAKKQRFLLKMKRDFLDNSDEIDWKDDNQEKFILLYEHRGNNIEISNWWGLQSSNMVTTNKEWLEEYIEKYEDEIKKYYFEIKEEKSLPNTTVIRSSLSSYIQLLEKIFKEPKIKITKDKLYVYDRVSGRKHTITAYLETKDVEILYYDGQDYVPVIENDTYKEIFKKTKELIGGISH